MLQRSLERADTSQVKEKRPLHLEDKNVSKRTFFRDSFCLRTGSFTSDHDLLPDY